MITHQKSPISQVNLKPNCTPVRPVTEVLLEIAYHLHANKVVRRDLGRGSLQKRMILRTI